MSDLPPGLEDTGTPRAGRRALDETRASARRTDAAIEEARGWLTLVKAHRERNHYADKMRLIIRGSTSA